MNWEHGVEQGSSALTLYILGVLSWTIGGPIWTILSVVAFVTATFNAFLCLRVFTHVVQGLLSQQREREHSALQRELAHLASMLTQLEQEERAILLHPDFRLLQSNVELLLHLLQVGTPSTFLSAYAHSIQAKVLEMKAIYAYN